MPILRVILWSTSLVLAAGCATQQQRTVIARVGSAELTLEEARRSIDTSYESLQSQLPRYVSMWTTNEMLYQEALQRGINRDESLKDRIAAVERQITIQEFLRQKTETDSIDDTDAALREYYRLHASEFVVREDMMKINQAIFATREAAGRFSSLLYKSNWNSAIQKIRDDSSYSPSLLTIETDRYYSQRTLFPQELWKIGVSLNNEETSFPVKTTQGYTIIQKISSVQTGQQAEYDLAYSEILDRYHIMIRRQRYEQLLGTLRQRYAVEVLTPTMMRPESALTVQPHE